MTSVPSLPPDEAMALLLFGKPASGLSAFELAQAAQGLAELTGQASGTGMLSRLRTGLGLDRLSVGSGSGANSPVSLEAGRYVAPGVYVGARQGAPATPAAAWCRSTCWSTSRSRATSAPIPTAASA